MNYAMPSCCRTLYMCIMQCYLVARHYIRQLCNAMLFSQASHMWIISCHTFFVFLITFVDNVCIFNCSSCASAIWIGDGEIWREKGLQSRQCYLLKQISCWLQIALQRRIQRQMTSPIIPLRCMLKLGSVILLTSCICCIAMLSFTSYTRYWMPSP